MSYKQYDKIKKDKEDTKTHLIRFLISEKKSNLFEQKLSSNGETASEVLRRAVDKYIGE